MWYRVVILSALNIFIHIQIWTKTYCWDGDEEWKECEYWTTIPANPFEFEFMQVKSNLVMDFVLSFPTR